MECGKTGLCSFIGRDLGGTRWCGMRTQQRKRFVIGNQRISMFEALEGGWRFMEEAKRSGFCR